MKIYAKSKEQAESSNELKEPHVIISINFPERPASSMDKALANPMTNKHTKEVLYLRFSDVGRLSNPVPSPEELAETPWCIPFNGDMARQVIKLLHRSKVERVVIHCLMGASRSASMANAISMYYNGEQVTSYPSVNELVYSVMLDELRKANV
jgi:predicted protein tyrosine phosphatase